MADEDLLTWAEKQAPWTRDALRRHALGCGHLTVADKADIIARVRHHAGIAINPAPECIHINSSHLGPSTASNTETTLVSFGPVENLNRLASGQQLQFALDGLTIIYGDNGSGKSGYARIAKKICRSATEAELLGNVFEKEPKPPAKVTIRYRPLGGKIIETVWTDGTPPPDALANIAVFDSSNARFFVDKENRVSFLPREIALLKSHAEHCEEMDALFDIEIKDLEKLLKTPLPGGYSNNGSISALLERLDGKKEDLIPTIDEIRSNAAWTEEDIRNLEELEKALTDDPVITAGRCRRAKAALEEYISNIESIEELLSMAMLNRLQALRANETLTAQTAMLAASDQFSLTPLKDVGQSAWRLMYDYAKAYAVSLDNKISKLPDAEGDLCLMCQEPLTATGARRIRDFNDFVAGETAKAADMARNACSDTIRIIETVRIPHPQAVENALAEYGSMSQFRKNNVDVLATYFAAANVRFEVLLKVFSTDEFDTVPALEVSPQQILRDEIVALETESAVLEKIAENDDYRNAQRSKIINARDRKKLSEDLATVLARRDNLDRILKIRRCREELKREYVGRKITDLRRSAVMADLEKRIMDEIKAFDLTHIPFQVIDRSKKGESLFNVSLQTSKTIANSKVLSEGEQRALALACFLGEAACHKALHGFVIDDPVSSLDHIRLRRVAIRLVEEAAKGRQVIIFTHNIHFFNEVVDEAARAEPQVRIVKNFIRSSSNENFGVISDIDEPWIIMPTTKRIAALRNRLKNFDTIFDYKADIWRSVAKEFYTDLRETWERFVEENLLGKTVERFKGEVKTQSLKEVVVEDADYKTIYFAMKRVSERSGHDTATGKNLPIPKPKDMKKDLDELDNFRIEINKRQKLAGQRRKALEEAPIAEVA